jgi:predicted regulator of Ras-like GTPase activity (Roadblock/LC7/MglB family)
MSDTKKEKLIELLRGMQKIGDIKGSIVVSRDGLVIASNISEIDADTFAAMSAAMQGAAETAASELKQGNVGQIIIETEKGKIISTGAGKKAIIVILTLKSINLGLAILEMGKTAQKIEGLLK